MFVASGDGAAAVCDDFNTHLPATGGIAANGFASTPYDVATGGTDFLDTFEGTSALLEHQQRPRGRSAKSYVPETPWNESCASSILFNFFGYKDAVSFCNSSLGSYFLDIVGGSGAPSFVYPKPFWQTGISVFRTMACAIFLMFLCLPLVGPGRTLSCSACPTRLREDVPATTQKR